MVCGKEATSYDKSEDVDKSFVILQKRLCKELIIVTYHGFFLASQTGDLNLLTFFSLIRLEIEGADKGSRKVQANARLPLFNICDVLDTFRY